MDTQNRIAELRVQFQKNPAAPAAAELVQLLGTEGLRAEARDICFRALAVNPRQPLIRLLLAKLFYLDGLTEFSVRELLELTKYSKSPALDKLLQAFGDLARAYAPGTPDKGVEKEEVVLAEADLEVDFTEACDELSDKT